MSQNQIPRLSKADALVTLIEKLLSLDMNLSPNPVLNGEGSVQHPGLDNHGMGTVFEELVRRFNEENNEEAGEHWTPRGAAGKSAPAHGWLGGFGRWNAGQSHLAAQIDDRPVARTSARRWFRSRKRGL